MIDVDRSTGSRSDRRHKSSVNIRFGFRVRDRTIAVGWVVQSADKGNQRMERSQTEVNVEAHPEKTHWYVALFKVLQNIQEYRSARIWIKDDGLLQHCAGAMDVDEDDPRSALLDSIVELSDEKFDSCEFRPTTGYGNDIDEMLDGGGLDG